MPLGKTREKVLFGIGSRRGSLHRYTIWRWAVGIVFTLGVALLPLTGTLRFDLWSGRHMWLGEEVDVVTAAKGFAFPFLAVNVAILLVSRFIGRYLCGFVCPVGAIARFAEWLRWSGAKRGRAIARHALLLVCCAVLAATAFSFWVDWRVFVDGSPTAATISATVLGGVTLGLYVAARWVGLRFCRDFCPSGIYFAVLGPKSSTGIEFAHPETCTDCHACEQVCPVDLAPREMRTAPMRPGTGLYPDGLSNYANCLRCGDCIAACEGTTSRFEVATPLRMGWLEEPGEPTPHGSDAPRSAEGPSDRDRADGTPPTEAAAVRTAARPEG